jgi:succinate-semialdehyde dehydrogenase/glutarate-semialdehyde dehydrogenase
VQAADQILKVSMELGGNAPFLVFEDADLDEVVDAAMTAKMRNIGEACTAANRFHVAEPIAREFAERLAQRMGAMKIGRGTDPGVEVGPLINEDQREKVEELVDDARERGATVLTEAVERFAAVVVADLVVAAGLVGVRPSQAPPASRVSLVGRDE